MKKRTLREVVKQLSDRTPIRELLWMRRKIRRLARKVPKFCIQTFRTVRLKLRPWQSEFFQRIMADFPEVLENGDRFASKPWASLRQIDDAVVRAIAQLGPIAALGFAHMSRLKAMWRMLSVDEYYTMCYAALKLARFIQDREVLGERVSSHEPVSLIVKREVRRNILFVTSQFPSAFHGGGKRVLNCIEFLARRNNVFLVTRYVAHLDEGKGGAALSLCASILRIPGVEWGDNSQQILEWLGPTKIDIVHYEWIDSLTNYCKRLGCYHMFTYMECISLRLLIDIQKAGKKKAISIFPKLLESLQLELIEVAPMNCRIAVTDKDAEFLRSFAPFLSFEVINTGFEFRCCEPSNREPETESMLFLGNYGHYPNVDAMYFFLGQVLPLIREKVPGVVVYVVGPNTPRHLMKRFSGKSIRFTGGVPDFCEYLQRVQVCVAPLVNGAGMRGKVVDYAAAMRPFVATDIAVAGLAFINDVDFLRANTAKEFADCSIRLFREPETARTLAVHAYETARENYSYDLVAQQYERLYERLENEIYGS
jgi:glycosyltransferase involved in cell wall biosynthesis